jgi:uncharacterized protein YecT (DUF1311 family)
MGPLWLKLMAVSIAMAAPAHAAAESPRDAFRACLDKSDGTNPARNACHTDTADILLETTLAKVLGVAKRFDAGFDPPASPAMATVIARQQGDWVKWQASACDFFGNRAQWGSDGRYLHGPECRIQMIEDRVDQLNELMALMSN